jgi:hypothetical protein|eukprot:CAMPEP_0181213770 /NCGR_PEP_ID=MMETSP1096-20121128/25088_1 /TAXON_ID=156174 ORGANISM="Chrysochromulina ericina, Strain CCMP281" /NCGR_SAMPLE_ID=MMETSP1096 /ASSEMBLY_ACC=CAM_ASM_000453 /LENGTH=80 /DNA_ID=CAMNT_0023305443 /DNA_START=122 /DNA_END=364 /DNA_ORIENTATION=+
MMPAPLDEGIQMACVLLPLLSLLIHCLKKSPTVAKLLGSAAPAQTSDEEEGGGTKFPALDTNLSEEELIKKRASEKQNGS